MADRLAGALERNALPLHLLSLFIAALVLLRVSRAQWFYADEWAYLSFTRDELPWWDELLTPHNGHLTAFPVVEYQVLRSLFGIRTYWPYIAVLLLVHLILVHLVWRTSIAIGGSRIIATALAGTLAIVGVGWENLLWAIGIGFVGSLALGFVAILVVTCREPSRTRDVMAVLAIAASMLFSGVGVVMLGIFALIIFLRERVRRAALLSVGPVSLYLLWRAAFPTGLYPEPDYHASTVREYADAFGPFVVHGLLGSLDAFLFDVSLFGAAALVALFIFALRSRALARADLAPAHALAVGAIGFLALTGYARIKLGVEYGASSRYAYVVIVLLAPLAVAALSHWSSGRGLWTLVICGAALAVAVHNVQLLREAAAVEGARKADLREAILAGAVIAQDPAQPMFAQTMPEPVLSGALTMADLRRFALSDDLPSLPSPSVATLLTTAAHVQVALGPHSLVDRGATKCETAAPGSAARIETFAAPAVAVLESDGPATFHVQLFDPASNASGAPRALSLSGVPADLVVLRPDTVAFVGPQDRAIRLCQGEGSS